MTGRLTDADLDAYEATGTFGASADVRRLIAECRKRGEELRQVESMLGAATKSLAETEDELAAMTERAEKAERELDGAETDRTALKLVLQTKIEWIGNVERALQELSATYADTCLELREALAAKEKAERELAEAVDALEKLAGLQSHYAELLNQYDGGNRLCFSSARQWLDRLKELAERHKARQERP